MDESLFVDELHPETQTDLFVDEPHPDIAKIRESVEPGIMGETRTPLQKGLEGTISALSGATMPATVASVPGMLKGAAGIAGKTLQKVPGLGNLGEYMSQFATNQALKNLGTVAGQVRQLGPEQAKEVADYYFKQGIGGPFTGSVGMKNKILGLEKSVGGEIGALRKGANVPQDVPGMLSSIKSQLDPEILVGARSGESGTYQKALDEIAKLGETASPAQLAEKATLLNREAKNLRSLAQPSGAMADVANELSRLNNASIKGALTPQQAARYEDLLSEYRKIQPMKAFEQRGELREMTQRGPGGGLTAGALRKLMDTIGYKSLAHAAHPVSEAMQAPLASNILPAAEGAGRLGLQSPLLEEYLRRRNNP